MARQKAFLTFQNFRRINLLIFIFSDLISCQSVQNYDALLEAQFVDLKQQISNAKQNSQLKLDTVHTEEVSFLE